MARLFTSFHQLMNTVAGTWFVDMSKKQFTPWDPQAGESAQAFAAFVAYRDLGPERSIDAVVRELDKSRTLIGRWSGRWKWVKRAQAYDAHLDEIKRKAHESAIANKARRIMSSYEVLEGMSGYGQGDITDLLNENGEFDLADIKRRGLGGLIKSITRHSNGSVARIEMYDAMEARETIGRYYKLWERGPREIRDPEAVLAKLLGISPKQLPPAYDVESDVDVPGEAGRECKRKQRALS